MGSLNGWSGDRVTATSIQIHSHPPRHFLVRPRGYAMLKYLAHFPVTRSTVQFFAQLIVLHMVLCPGSLLLLRSPRRPNPFLGHIGALDTRSNRFMKSFRGSCECLELTIPKSISGVVAGGGGGATRRIYGIFSTRQDAVNGEGQCGGP